MRRERTGSARRLAQLDETKPIFTGRTKRRAKGGFLLYRARHVCPQGPLSCPSGNSPCLLPRQKKMWESGEAPPVAEQASRFRGSAPAGGPEGDGRRSARRCKHSGHRTGAFPAPKAALELSEKGRIFPRLQSVTPAPRRAAPEHPGTGIGRTQVSAPEHPAQLPGNATAPAPLRKSRPLGEAAPRSRSRPPKSAGKRGKRSAAGKRSSAYSSVSRLVTAMDSSSSCLSSTKSGQLVMGIPLALWPRGAPLKLHLLGGSEFRLRVVGPGSAFLPSALGPMLVGFAGPPLPTKFPFCGDRLDAAFSGEARL